MKEPQLAQRTLAAVGRAITGDTIDAEKGPIAPCLSCPKLVAFFNEFGANDTYPAAGGFPSRWQHAERKLNEAEWVASDCPRNRRGCISREVS